MQLEISFSTRNRTGQIPRVPELLNPNGRVNEWSYGYRATPAGTALTLFTVSPDEHSNAALPEHVDAIEGWQQPGGFWPIIAANVTGAPVSWTVLPLDPSELVVHPGNGFTSQASAVVRWTAPTTGTCNISARWRDLDPNGGNGFGAYVVLNGVSIFAANPANGGSTSDEQAISLSAGDLLDFVVDPGPNGDQSFDTTALRISISTESPTLRDLLQNSLQRLVQTPPNPAEIQVEFTPNLGWRLQDVASRFGFDHFNFYQHFTRFVFPSPLPGGIGQGVLDYLTSRGLGSRSGPRG